MMGFWKLVKSAHVLKICSEICSELSGMNFKIWKVLMRWIALSMWIRARAIRLVLVTSAPVSWARLAVLKAGMYSLHPRLRSSSSTRKPRSAMMASPGWSLARSSSQVIVLSLAQPPQAEETKLIPPFIEHPTRNLIVMWCLYALNICCLADKPDGRLAKISVQSITIFVSGKSRKLGAPINGKSVVTAAVISSSSCAKKFTQVVNMFENAEVERPKCFAAIFTGTPVLRRKRTAINCSSTLGPRTYGRRNCFPFFFLEQSSFIVAFPLHHRSTFAFGRRWSHRNSNTSSFGSPVHTENSSSLCLTDSIEIVFLQADASSSLSEVFSFSSFWICSTTPGGKGLPSGSTGK